MWAAWGDRAQSVAQSGLLAWLRPCGLVNRTSGGGIWAVLVQCRNYAGRITLVLAVAFTRARLIKALLYGTGLKGDAMLTQEKPTGLVRWSIPRMAVGSEVQCYLLSGRFVRVVTHFFERTFVCPETEACEACRLLPGRPYYYLPMLGAAQSTRGLLELSSTASMDLEQACRFAGLEVTAGVHLLVRRPQKMRPLRMEVLGFREEVPEVPEHLWVTGLMAIYGLPAMHDGESLADYCARVRRAAVSRANLVAEVYEKSGRVRPNGRPR